MNSAVLECLALTAEMVASATSARKRLSSNNLRQGSVVRNVAHRTRNRSMGVDALRSALVQGSQGAGLSPGNDPGWESKASPSSRPDLAPVRVRLSGTKSWPGVPKERALIK